MTYIVDGDLEGGEFSGVSSNRFASGCVIQTAWGIMLHNHLQSGLKSRGTRRQFQRLAWVEETRLRDSVVLGMEFECDGVANGGRDVGWVVV